MLRTVFAFLLLLGSLLPVSAVLIDTNGTTTYQITEPTNTEVTGWTSGWGSSGVTGWDYVGQVNGSSAVYLGNDWVITAGHVGSGNFTLDSTTYTMAAGTATSISDSNGIADLTVFQITTAPTLPSLLIGTATLNGTVVMTGYGGGQGETWGANTISQTDILVQVNGFSYQTVDFETIYGGSNLAQLIGGDSGGGDFMYDFAAHKWKLVGINEATDDSGHGDSYMVQLDNYSTQIDQVEFSAIPEPQEWMLLLLGIVALCVGRKIQGYRR